MDEEAVLGHGPVGHEVAVEARQAAEAGCYVSQIHGLGPRVVEVEHAAGVCLDVVGHGQGSFNRRAC